MRHPTNVNMKNKSFIFMAHVIAEQFKQSGITVLALIKSTLCIALSDTNN
jgi:translation initiation factor 2B subunit (eIF-2B alpha/beta/delta family)